MENKRWLRRYQVCEEFGISPYFLQKLIDVGIVKIRRKTRKGYAPYGRLDRREVMSALGIDSDMP